jgi:lipid-A-disaccharide synthase
VSDPVFAMVAGEASGDVLAGVLLDGMRARWPGLVAHGIGGPEMAARGFEAWWPHHKLAVRGYAEVVSHFREIVAIRSKLTDRLLGKDAVRPDCFIGVDAPDFNLDLEVKLKSAGVKTVHFISPSIWAWRGKRIEKIAKAADLVLCIFPFEPEIYAKRGIRAVYVGHPLASRIPIDPPKQAAREALGIADDETCVALLPGSRRAEIQYIAPRLFGAAAEMATRRDKLRFVLPVVTGLRHAVEPLRKQYAPDLPIDLLDGRAHDALAAADVVLVASGTATLETALFKRPMVIVYAMHPLTWQMGKRMNYQPWVGLPNILLREFAVPELLQRDASPAKIADAAFAWIDHPERVAELADKFEGLHMLLSRDTPTIAAGAIAELLGR